VQAVIDPETLRGVVASAATGDEVAFARIVAAHHDDMARVSFVVCGDVTLAQEAVQSAWPKVWAKLDTVRDPSRLRPWLVSVAANEAKQLARSRNRRWVREVSIDDGEGAHASGSMSVAAVSRQASGSPRSRADPADRAGELDLANALAGFTPDDRILVALRYAAGLTSDEIGRVIGMTGGGVRARLARLLHRLREELQDD
jgi:RNA polymerase sigma-70 factor (ECF subfamily)